MADDYSANTSTTGRLTVGQPSQARFEQAYDTDWFKFHADAGQHYAFTGTGPGDAASGPRSVMLYDANGRMIEGWATEFAPEQTGDYFVATSSNVVGDYSLLLSLLGDDYSADDSNPGRLFEGGQSNGVISYQGDVDRFVLPMLAGQIYTIRYAAGDGQSSLSLTPFSAVEGKQLVWADVRGQDGSTQVVVMPTVSGNVSFNLAANYGAPTGMGYSIRVLPTSSDDYAGTIGGATALSVGSTVRGAVQAGPDIDTFRLDLQAGVTYQLKMDAVQGPASYYHPSFTLVDASGKTLAQPSPGELTPLTYTPTLAGSYYVNVAGYFPGSAAYSLTASLAPDDVGANAASAGSTSVGKTVKGELEAGGGDRDWYRVALDAGSTYWFSLLGQAEGQGTLATYPQAIIKVLDATGQVLASSEKLNAYSATAATLSFMPASRDSYYVEVSGQGPIVGTYQLQTRIGVPDDVGNDRAHASPLATGVLINGALEVPADQDVYKFSAAPGGSYAFKLTPRISDGINSSISLGAYDASGSWLPLRQVGSDKGGALYLYDAGSGGDIYLNLGNTWFSGAPGPRGYQLTALRYGADDYSADSKTSAQLSVNSQTVARYDAPADRDWFKLHLDAGRTYVFDVMGALSGNGSLDIKAAKVGAFLTTAGNSFLAGVSTLDGGELRLRYTATQSGDYFLDVGAQGQQTGSYTVQMSDTTGDVVAPTVSAVTPAAGASGVSPTANLDVSFSENIMLGATSGITLNDSSGRAVEAFGYGHTAVTAGQHLLMNPNNLTPGMSYTLQIAPGSVLDLAGNTLATPFSTRFTVMAPVATGGSGNDLLIGKADGSTIDGGAGTDTVSYSLNYFLTHAQDGSYLIRNWQDNTFDTLVGIERVLFPTHATALDVNGAGGQAYRLYQAAFNRTPDAAGLGYWISKMDAGYSLHNVAHDFVGSNEFMNTYGSQPSDADFVSLLYHNVLHRDGEAAGVAYWRQVLGAGTAREDVLIAFSESAENQSAVIGTIANGFDYTPFG